MTAEAALRRSKESLAKLQRDAEGFRPWYWTTGRPPRDDFKVEVTREMKGKMQQLWDGSCVAGALGQGRDQRAKQRYSGMKVFKVFRVENPAV